MIAVNTKKGIHMKMTDPRLLALLLVSLTMSHPSAIAGVHKCRVGNTVTYTDDPCPTPQAEQAMTGGSVTIVKGQRPSALQSAKSASAPNVRDLLGARDDPSIRDKQIERAIGQ